MMADEFEGDNPDDMIEPPSFFPLDDGAERVPTSLGDPVDVQIVGVFATEMSGQISRFVLLSDGDRKVPIIIGPYEAQAITLALEGTRPDRPMSHDLFKTVIERLDSTLDRVVIDDLWSTTYYAKLYFKKGSEEIEIDARPSDAIALAVRFDAPIQVVEGILDTVTEE